MSTLPQALLKCVLGASFLQWPAFQINAAEKFNVIVNGEPIAVYRTADLETASKEASAAHKAVAWIASSPKVLDGKGTISQTTPRGATLHALFALRHRTVLVFMDAYEENHKVPRFIDEALHTPDPHYTPPTVLLLSSDAKKVIATVTYEPDFVKRAKALAKALDDAKGSL